MSTPSPGPDKVEQFKKALESYHKISRQSQRKIYTGLFISSVSSVALAVAWVATEAHGHKIFVVVPIAMLLAPWYCFYKHQKRVERTQKRLASGELSVIDLMQKFPAVRVSRPLFKLVRRAKSDQSLKLPLYRFAVRSLILRRCFAAVGFAAPAWLYMTFSAKPDVAVGWILMIFSMGLLLDCVLASFRYSRGYYGKSALEVMEVARFLASRQQGGSNGSGQQYYVEEEARTAPASVLEGQTVGV